MDEATYIQHACLLACLMLPASCRWVCMYDAYDGSTSGVLCSRCPTGGNTKQMRYQRLEYRASAVLFIE